MTIFGKEYEKILGNRKQKTHKDKEFIGIVTFRKKLENTVIVKASNIDEAVNKLSLYVEYLNDNNEHWFGTYKGHIVDPNKLDILE